MYQKIIICFIGSFFLFAACSFPPKIPPDPVEPYFSKKQIVSGIRGYWDMQSCGHEYHTEFQTDKNTLFKKHSEIRLDRDDYTFESTEDVYPNHPQRYFKAKKICH